MSLQRAILQKGVKNGSNPIKTWRLNRKTWCMNEWTLVFQITDFQRNKKRTKEDYGDGYGDEDDGDDDERKKGFI